MKTTKELHNDSRSTVVLVGEQVFELVLSSTWNKSNLLDTPPKDRPHVRILNEIPIRTKAEQEQKNKEDGILHGLHAQIPKPVVTHLSRTKANIANGANIEIEIKKLLGLKKNAKGTEAIRIRKALRKLGYKRYTTKEE